MTFLRHRCEVSNSTGNFQRNRTSHQFVEKTGGEAFDSQNSLRLCNDVLYCDVLSCQITARPLRFEGHGGEAGYFCVMRPCRDWIFELFYLTSLPILLSAMRNVFDTCLRNSIGKWVWIGNCESFATAKTFSLPRKKSQANISISIFCYLDQFENLKLQETILLLCLL